MANSFEMKLDSERSKLLASSSSHTSQIHDLHNQLKQKQEEYHHVMIAVKEEHRAQLSFEVARLGKEHRGALVKELTAQSEKKAAEMFTYKAKIASEAAERQAVHEADVAFYEGKVKKLEAAVASSGERLAEAAANLLKVTALSDSRLAAKARELESSKDSLAATASKLSALRFKFAASKALFDSADMKVATLTTVESARDLAQSALASATTRLETLLPAHSRQTLDLHAAGAELDALQIESSAEIGALKGKLEDSTKTAATLRSQLGNEKATNKALTGKESHKESEALKTIKVNHDKMAAEKDSQLRLVHQEVQKAKEQVATLKSEAVAKKLHTATTWSKAKTDFAHKAAALESEVKSKTIQLERLPEFERAIAKQKEICEAAKSQLRKVKEEAEAAEEHSAVRVKEAKEGEERARNDAKKEAAEAIREAAGKAKNLVSEAEADGRKWKDLAAELRGKAAKAEGERDEMKGKVEKVTARNAEMQHEIEVAVGNVATTQQVFKKDEEKRAHALRKLNRAGETIEKLEAENASLKARLKKKKEEKEEEEAGGEKGGKEGKKKESILSKKDIRDIVKHLDHAMGNDDGSISVQEFERAIRTCRRAKSCAQEHARGRFLVARLERMIDARGLGIMEWYKQCVAEHGSVKNGGGEGGLTSVLIAESFRRLHEGRPDLEELGRDDVADLVHYLDPNLDGHVTKQEVKDGFRRAHLPPNSLQAEYNCGVAMEKLSGYMDKKMLRVQDLFSLMDRNHDGALSLEEFESGIIKTAGIEKFKGDEIV